MDILNISHRVEAVKYNHSETQFCLRMLDRIDFVPILTYVGFLKGMDTISISDSQKFIV
jgi:hypothetical protein